MNGRPAKGPVSRVVMTGGLSSIEAGVAISESSSGDDGFAVPGEGVSWIREKLLSVPFLCFSGDLISRPSETRGKWSSRIRVIAAR